jgi:hypothetical protein
MGATAVAPSEKRASRRGYSQLPLIKTDRHPSTFSKLLHDGWLLLGAIVIIVVASVESNAFLPNSFVHVMRSIFR